MSLRHPAVAAGENTGGAASGEDTLSSLADAMLRDHERARHARESLEDAESLLGWAARFAVLSDANRLRILLSMHRSPGITVGGLASAVGMSDNATSQALAALRVAGVVEATRDGRFRRWSIVDQDVHALLHRVGQEDPEHGSDQDS